MSVSKVNQLKLGYFLWYNSVCYTDFYSVFEAQTLGDNNEDVVKLTGFYFLHYDLIKVDNRKVVGRLDALEFDGWFDKIGYTKKVQRHCQPISTFCRSPRNV